MHMSIYMHIYVNIHIIDYHAQVGETVGLLNTDPLQPPACLGLTLSNQAVLDAENKREAEGGR